MHIYDVKIDGMSNPIGIDNKKPVLSWKISSDKRNVFQTSYRIIVSKNKDCTAGDCWDSGIVLSSRSFSVPYEGKELEADTRYYCRISAEVNNKIIQSEIGMFTTALLGGKFKGNWISIEKDKIETAPLVRKSFNARDIVSATMYVFSYGWYELYVNGNRFDERMFVSHYSEYKDKLFYDVYDLTDKLNDGENVVGLMIGNGYNHNANRFMNHWKGKKRFIAFISIHKHDGSVEYIGSNSDWKFTIDSPVLKNHIYNGEFYDARKEICNWSTPKFDDSKWEFTELIEEKNYIFKHIPTPAIRISEIFNPKKVYKLKNGSYIVDFGQNMAGFVGFSLHGNRGDSITIKHAEEIRLLSDGEYGLDVFTNRYAGATDTYIFKGLERETYHPHFTYHGFRYAEITGMAEEPKIGNLYACAVHTAFDGEAVFKTDNDLINKLYNNAVWSIRSNNLSYSSDCAARDERTPCAMDLMTYQDAALYCADMQSYFRRWLFRTSECDAKYKFPSWDGQSILMTKLLYLHCGDIEILKEMHENNAWRMNKYISQWPDARIKGKDDVSFGDWCAPNVPGNYETSADSRWEVETAMLAICAECMSFIEKTLGNNKKSAYYYNFYETACKAYNEMFFDKDKKVYSSGKQTPNILALSADLVNDKHKAQVADNLITNIRKEGKLDTGIFGTRYFIECLSDSGDIDLAFKCFFNKEYPSFRYQFDRGATTLWEQWYETGNMASHNHAMFAGAITGLFTRLAGIIPLDAGFAKVLIKPIFAKCVNNLETEIETVLGKIGVKWVRRNGIITIDIKIPPNATAVAVFPGEAVNELVNGQYTFEFKEIN